MLKFEFVQPGEFDLPYYSIKNKCGNIGGELFYHLKHKIWAFMFYSERGLTSDSLEQIAAKLKQLNQATQSQRILGVF